MTKRIAILVIAMGMSIGLANRVTTIALAQPQDDKMQSDGNMKDDKMKDDKMAGGKMGKMDKMDDQGKTEEKKN